MFAKFDNKDIAIKIKRQKEGEQFLIYTNSLPINKRNKNTMKKNNNGLLTLTKMQIAHK